ncbi:MAG: glycogen synthase GlgA [Myxococcaceae bacterium]
MRVLFVSPEVASFSRTGGLGDVCSALSTALAALGVQVDVVTPGYRQISNDGLRTLPGKTKVSFPHRIEELGTRVRVESPSHRVFLLDHLSFSERDGLYGDAQGPFADNAERFALLSFGALALAERLALAPDVVHAHDWQGGLAMFALKRRDPRSPLGRARGVMTLHNVAYQGVFPKHLVETLGLGWDAFTPQRIEFHDQVSFLKAGVAYADAVTTVSARYAREIETPEFGEGLHDFLRENRKKLVGIVNGIDTTEWNPATDHNIAARYSATDLSGKAACKQALRQELGLDPAGNPPLFVIVSRFVSQKGLTLVLDVLDALMERGAQLAVLGTGDGALENAFLAAAKKYPARVGVRIGFLPALAHRMEAGGDFFLMPSRFEPCGLNQMYSLRYGTLPIVRATGGLDDTVTDLAEPRANGIKFQAWDAESFWHAVERGLALYRDTPALTALQKRGMALDLGWEKAARQYLEVYRAGGG